MVIWEDKMPMYDQECLQCGHSEEEYYRTSEEPLRCSLCGGVARKLITADTTASIVDGPIYVDQVGKHFPNRAAKEAYYKKKGLVELGVEEGDRHGIVVRNRAEAEVRKHGYRDLEEYNGRKQ